MGQLFSQFQRAAEEAHVDVPAIEEPTIAEPPSPTFTLFRKLPPEMRDRIWKFSLPGPRTITIFPWECTSVRRRYHDIPQSLPDEDEIPLILHVCRDSRANALKDYSPAFSSRLLRNVYFNFDIDTLCLFEYHTLKSFQLSYVPLMENQKAESHVKRLHIGVDCELSSARKTFLRIKEFKALENLVVEYSESNHGPYGERELTVLFMLGWSNLPTAWTAEMTWPTDTRVRHGDIEYLLSAPPFSGLKIV